jgi:hypothetical protein
MAQVCMLRHSRTYLDCVNAGDGWSWALHYEYGAYQDQATCEVGTCHPYLTADKVPHLCLLFSLMWAAGTECVLCTCACAVVCAVSIACVACV